MQFFQGKKGSNSFSYLSSPAPKLSKASLLLRLFLKKTIEMGSEYTCVQGPFFLTIC